MAEAAIGWLDHCLHTAPLTYFEFAASAASPLSIELVEAKIAFYRVSRIKIAIHWQLESLCAPASDVYLPINSHLFDLCRISNILNMNL